jgi:hypothetical protein
MKSDVKERVHQKLKEVLDNLTEELDRDAVPPTCGKCYFYRPCEDPQCPEEKPPHGHCFSEPPLTLLKVTKVDEKLVEDEQIGMTGPCEVEHSRRHCRHFQWHE